MLPLIIDWIAQLLERQERSWDVAKRRKWVSPKLECRPLKDALSDRSWCAKWEEPLRDAVLAEMSTWPVLRRYPLQEWEKASVLQAIATPPLSDYEKDDLESKLQIETLTRAANEYQAKLKVERSCCCNAWRPRWWRHNAALTEGFPKAGLMGTWTKP